MKLYIVRHGETECNVRQVYYGSLDVPITENGKKQAEAVGDMLEDIAFDQVITSGLLRTQQTASAILSKNQKTVLPENGMCRVHKFNEMNFGAWEGMHYTEVREQYPEDYAAMANDWMHCAPTGGEVFNDFSQRIVGGWEALLAREDIKRAENILFVGHGGPIQCLICYLLGMDMSRIWQFSIQQGVYTEFEIVRDFPVLKGLNVGC
jgi:alpha-ribazole phosphatase